MFVAWAWLGRMLGKWAVLKSDCRQARPKRFPWGSVAAPDSRHGHVIPRNQAA